MPPPPQRPPAPYRARSLDSHRGRQTQGTPTLMSITAKMVNMQSTYDQTARPIVDASQNGSNSNFNVEPFQVKNSNFKVLKDKSDHNQSSHALKHVIQDQ